MRVALLRCAVLPDPDPDEAPLIEALQRAGVRAQSLVWDAPEAPLASFDALVLRSTWDYHLQTERFLTFLDEASEASVLVNPAPAVRATYHKRYLLDLACSGVPVLATALTERGSEPSLPEAWPQVVIKPAVSCGSWRTRRFERGDPAATAFLASCLAERDMLVQPLVEGFTDPGERSLIWIGGALSHAVLKRPRFEGQEESIEPLTSIRASDRAIASAALARIPSPLAFARVDLVETDGDTVVSEIECIEPSLFLDTRPGSADALAAAILEHIRDR